jgi:hypothetical protein
VPGRLLIGPPFDIAQDHRQPLVGRQSAQFLIEQGQQVPPEMVRWASGLGDLVHLLLPGLAFDGNRPGLAGNVVGHAMKPVPDFLARRDRARLPGQYEKRGLEGVLGIFGMPEETPTHPHHHGTMPTDEGFESGLLPVLQEALQQLPVCPFSAVRCGTQAPQGGDQLAQGGGHPSTLYPVGTSAFTRLFPGQGLFLTLF